MTLFKTAQRTQAKLRLAIDGPSGSGKTYSALLIAKGLAGGDLTKVALIDTERGSGSLYADLGPYAILDFGPPYTVKRFVTAHDAAVEEGFTVIVFDSLTHFWSGEGGILDAVDKFSKASTSGNSFAAWKQGTPLQKQLFDTMLASPVHVVATIRSKTEWVLEENEKGKKVPRKVGLAPDQRKDIDYEFTLVLDLSRDHIAQASKDRTGLFDDRLEVPSEAMGTELAAWLGSATPEPPKADRAVMQDAQREQAAVAAAQPAPSGNGDSKLIGAAAQERLGQLILSRGRTVTGVLAAARKKGIGEGLLETLTMGQAKKIAEAMKELPKAEAPAAAEEHYGDVEAEAAAGAPEAPVAATEAAAPQDEAVSEDLDPKGGPDEGETPPGMDLEAFKASRAEMGKRKAGSVTPEQLTMIAALCAKLERLGVSEAEWRVFMADEFGVASRTELVKSTTAPKAREALQRWVIDLESGVAVAGAGRRAVA